MGMLIALPSSEHFTYHEKYRQHISDLVSCRKNEDLCLQEPLDRDVLRAYMLAHSLKGSRFMPARTPFIGKVTKVHSPEDKEVVFGIRRVDNRHHVEFQDARSTVRYVSEESAKGTRLISERDYPVGTQRLDIIMASLESWNITDESGVLIPIDDDTVLDYLTPNEFSFLYEESIKINPILVGREEEKND